jgi:hypothetical protein
MKLFFYSYLQLALVSISTILITKHLYFGIFVSSFLISLLWTYNVSKVVISTYNQKILYSLGAGAGAISGVFFISIFK